MGRTRVGQNSTGKGEVCAPVAEAVVQPSGTGGQWDLQLARSHWCILSGGTGTIPSPRGAHRRTWKFRQPTLGTWLGKERYLRYYRVKGIFKKGGIEMVLGG
jgi:hypothetical protein